MHLQNDHQGRHCRQFISGKIKPKSSVQLNLQQPQNNKT